MEDTVGNMAYFTPAEQELLGVRGPQPIDSLDMTTHYDRVRDRREYVRRKYEETEGDYDELKKREAELYQLDWDEATLIDIEFDLAPRRAILGDVLFGRMMDNSGPAN